MARYSSGQERARQHIEEFHAFESELGGSVTDVQQYFFDLPRNQLKKILVTYREKYGDDPANYAEETLPKWRSGKRRMSGLV